jgi:hypothetical protein
MTEHPLRNYCPRLVDPQLASASVSQYDAPLRRRLPSSPPTPHAVPSLAIAIVDVLRKRDARPTVVIGNRDLDRERWLA